MKYKLEYNYTGEAEHMVSFFSKALKELADEYVVFTNSEIESENVSSEYRVSLNNETANLSIGEVE